jgi:hypothetical protein
MRREPRRPPRHESRRQRRRQWQLQEEREEREFKARQRAFFREKLAQLPPENLLGFGMFCFDLAKVLRDEEP